MKAETSCDFGGLRASTNVWALPATTLRSRKIGPM